MESYYRVRLDDDNTSFLQATGFELASIPVKTYSMQNRDRFTIPNRDGELLSSQEWRANAYINCVFHTRLIDGFGVPSAYDTVDAKLNYLLVNCLKKAKILHLESRKIHDASESSVVDDTSDGWKADGYVEILGFTVVGITRIGNDYCRVEVQFEVYPYQFAEPDPTYPYYTIDTSGTLDNLYDDALPLYNVLSHTTDTTETFSINGNSFTVQIPSWTTSSWVDVRRQIAYGIRNGQKVAMNAAGDYTGLVLKGLYQNVVTGTVSIYPNWGWKL